MNYRDIIQLGRHRLMCGDSTNINDVRLLLNGTKADMVFIDPPYGINYKGCRYDLRKKKQIKIGDDYTKLNTAKLLNNTILRTAKPLADIYILYHLLDRKCIWIIWIA